MFNELPQAIEFFHSFTSNLSNQTEIEEGLEVKFYQERKQRDEKFRNGVK